MLADRREALYETLLERLTSTKKPVDGWAIAASINLALTCDVQQSFFYKKFSHYGLQRSSFNLMVLLLFGSPDGIQLSELGDMLITSRANITGLVDHLEEKGLVRRVIDRTDRRARLAKLTPKGAAALQEIMPVQQEQVRQFFSGLTEEEMATLVQLLKKIRRSDAVAQHSAETNLEAFANEGMS